MTYYVCFLDVQGIQNAYTGKEAYKIGGYSAAVMLTNVTCRIVSQCSR